MKVLNIGTSELKIIGDALEYYGRVFEMQARNETSQEIRDVAEYEAAHIRTTKKLLQDMRLQELCERSLSYFWDRLVAEGLDNPDVEYLADDMGISEIELKTDDDDEDEEY